MVRADATCLWCKAVGECHLELIKGTHLAIEPRLGVGAQAVSPAETRAQVAHPEPAEPPDRIIQSRVLEMKPLADSE
jgi:hypothetical protein